MVRDIGKFRGVLGLAAIIAWHSVQAQFAPGTWREHLPFHSSIDVEFGGEKIYSATPYSIFSFQPSDNTIERFGKTTGLSDIGVSAIKFDADEKQLLIAYTNSNIDIIRGAKTYNIPDLVTNNVIGDRGIYDIYYEDGIFYLSSGIGVILIDARRYEVRESWLFGNAGSRIRVNSFTSDRDYFFAATADGLKRISKTDINPADYSRWENLPSSPPGECRQVIECAGSVFALFGNEIYLVQSPGSSLWFTGPTINFIESSSQKILIGIETTAGSRVKVISPNGILQNNLLHINYIFSPRDAIVVNNAVWVSDSIGGLTKFEGNVVENIPVNSPQSVALGKMIAQNREVIASSGGIDDDWNGLGNKNGIYHFINGTWKNYNEKNYAALANLVDVTAIEKDPNNGSIWAGSFGSGLVNISMNGQFSFFTSNSPLSPSPGGSSRYLVSGLKFDVNKYLWISNPGTSFPLHVRLNENSWESFSVPITISGNRIGEILVDDEDQKWVLTHKQGVLVFNHGADVQYKSDDKWKLLTSIAGQGSLPSNEILSLAKDKDGFIWIGTANGIAVVYCPERIFTNGCEPLLPVINDGGFNGYLFRGERVQGIAIDGANRKWIATANGVWLMNSAADKIILHFNEQNSPLSSNDVRSISIDGITGEVYFSTAKGITSFTGDATEGAANNSNILIFPNPVPPDHQGHVVIRGLKSESVVRITELNGRLVYQGISKGGQLSWNGRDSRGNQISSGVYLVILTDKKGKESTAGRIIFISR